jgi:hypothetical protein
VSPLIVALNRNTQIDSIADSHASNSTMGRPAWVPKLAPRPVPCKSLILNCSQAVTLKLSAFHLDSIPIPLSLSRGRAKSQTSRRDPT